MRAPAPAIVRRALPLVLGACLYGWREVLAVTLAVLGVFLWLQAILWGLWLLDD